MALKYEQQLALRVELETDPKTLGYSGKDTNECAALLNQVGLSGETLPNISVAVSDVLLAIDPDEVSSVHIVKFQLFGMLMSGSVDLSENSDLEISVKKIFTGCANTLSALDSLRAVSVSRAEKLFGKGITITHTDVGRARQVV